MDIDHNSKATHMNLISIMGHKVQKKIFGVLSTIKLKIKIPNYSQTTKYI